jgi:hypothetical protein
MKTSSLLFSLLIFIVNKNISQNYETGIYERIDTVVIFDPATNIEEIKIVKSLNVYIDVDNCESIPKKFVAKTSNVKVAQVKELSAIALRCSGKFQGNWNSEWTIQSFNMVIYRAKQAPRTIANWGSDFTPETRRALEEIKSGELIAFEQVVLVHKQKGLFTTGFSLQIK